MSSINLSLSRAEHEKKKKKKKKLYNLGNWLLTEILYSMKIYHRLTVLNIMVDKCTSFARSRLSMTTEPSSFKCCLYTNVMSHISYSSYIIYKLLEVIVSTTRPTMHTPSTPPSQSKRGLYRGGGYSVFIIGPPNQHRLTVATSVSTINQWFEKNQPPFQIFFI